MTREEEVLHLWDQILSISGVLDELGVDHAFGGAIALLYYSEPRATNDIDVNVSCSPEDSGRVLDALEKLGVEVDEQRRQIVTRDGQVRLRWRGVPVDLFFANTPFHDAMRERSKRVPFAGREIPILAPEHLIACKAIFNRPKDWVDIENMRRELYEVDVDEALKWVRCVAGTEVVYRLDEVLRVTGLQGPGPPSDPD